MRSELVAEYHRLLSQTKAMLALQREKQWGSILQSWRDELTTLPAVELRQHAELCPDKICSSLEWRLSI